MDKPLNSKANILIVDDDVLIAESNKFILKKAGYNIAGIATEGLQAIKLAKEKQPDLILMDVNLGSSMDGITAAEEIQKFADIPFIFLTAYSDNATIERAKKVGPFGYLIKPFDNRELIIALETSLYKHSFEKKTKEQELLFRTVANFAYEWEFWLSPDLQFKYCSPSCQRITGYGSEEFTSNPKLIFDIVHPDDKNAFEKHIQDNYHGEKDGVVTDYQFRIIDKQGAVKFISHTCSSIFDDKNNYLGRRGTNVDITERKIAEEQIREANLGLQLAIEGGELGTFDADITNGKVRVNDRYLIMLGYSPDEIEVTSKFWTTLIHPEDLQKVLDLSNKIESGEIKEMETEYRVKHKSGNWIWLRDKAKGFDYDSSGKPARSAGTHRDITTKKQAEEAIRQSEETFRELYEQSPVGYQSLDEEGRFITVNDVWINILGYQKEEVLGKWFGDFLAPEYVEPFRERFPLFKAQGKIHSEFYMMRKNGERAYIAFEGRIGYKPSGEFKQTHCVLSDQTARKLFEESLKKQKEEFETIFNLVPAQIWYKDAYNNFIKVNRQVCEDIGLPNDEIDGRSAEELFPSFAKQYYEDDLDVINSGKPKLGISEQINTASGELRWVHTDKVPVFGKDGKVNGLIAFTQDVTERKHAEEALLESEKNFRLLFENSPIGIYVAKANGEIVNVNSALLNILNSPSIEATKQINVLTFPPLVNNGYAAKFVQCVEQNKTISFEIEYTSKWGKTAVLSSYLIPLTDEYGKVVNIYTIMEDITERKNAEEALKVSEQNYREIYNSTTEAIFIHDAVTYKIIDVNDSMLKMYNYNSREEYLDNPKYHFGLLEPPFTRENAYNYLQKTVTEGPQTFEWLTCKKNGEAFWTEVSLRLSEIGGEKKILAVVRNIEERKKAEEALHESEKNYRMIFNSTNEAIMIHDPENGKTVDVNDTMLKMYGYNNKEEFFSTYAENFRGEEPPYNNETAILLIRKAANEGPQTFEWLSQKKNRERFWTEVSLKKTEIDGKDRVLAVVRDISERKEAEKSLRENEEKFRALFEQSGDYALVLEPTADGSLKIMNANSAAIRVHGYTREEIINSPLTIIDPSAGKYDNDERIKKLMDGEVIQFETYHKRKDGTQFPVEVIAKAVKIADKPLMIFSTERDITERKKIVEALKKSQEALIEAQHIAHVGNWEYDVSLNKTIWSKEMFLIFGRDPSLGEPSWSEHRSTIHVDDWEMVDAAIQAAAKDGIPYSLEFRIVHKNGDIRWTLTIGKTERDYTGKVSRIFGTVQDTTDRKKIEEALTTSEKQYRLLFNASPVGIGMANLNGNVLTANNVMEQITGYNFEKEKNITVLDTYVNKEERQKLLAELSANGKVRDWEVELKRKDGSNYYALLNVDFIVLGESKYILTNLRDITEHKKAEIALRENKERWESLFNNSPNAIAIYQAVNDGKDFVFTDFNLTAQITDKVSRDEVVGKRISELFPGAEELGFLEIFRKVWSTGNTEYIKSSYYKDNRLTGWRENIIYKLNTGEIVAIYNDVTERMEAEMKIRQSEQKFRSLFENAADPILLVDLDGTILDANPATCGALGYDCNELCGMKTIELNTEEYKPQVKERFEIINKEGKLFFETTHRAKNGSLLQFEISSKVIEYEGRKVILSVYRDITIRKEAEITLRESEERFKTIYNFSPESISISEIETGKLIEVNESYEKLFGHTREEVIGKTSFEVGIWTNENDRKKILDAVHNNGFYDNFESKLKRKDGSIIYCLISGRIIFMHDRKYMLAMVNDITELKNTERAIKESEQKFRNIFENHAAVKLLMDPDTGKIVDANKAASEYYGWTRDELKQMKIQQINTLPPEQALKEMQKVKNQKQTHFEFRHRLKDGSIRDVEIFSSKIEIGGKDYLHSINHDITDRKIAEEELKRFFNLVPDMVCIASSDGKFEELNSAWEIYLGYSKEEMLSKPFADFVHPDDLEATIKEVSKQLSGKPTVNFVNRYRAKNGEYKELDWVASPSPDGKKLYAAARDITERRITENKLKEYQNHLEELIETRTEELDKLNVDLKEQLQKEKELEMMLRRSLGKEKELNELKTRFISTASHEFRTPLTAVLASTEMIQRYGKKWSEEKYNEYINKIKKSVSYLTKLMDDVLTISRSESGKILYNPDMVNLYKLCTEIIEETRSNTNAQHDFVFNFSMRKIKYHLDPNLIKFILTNLLSNAFKYSPEGGKIELSVSSKKDQIEITVADEGIGIPVEDMIHLFEPFHRSANTVEIPGTGLGLSIVKHAIELHKGKIVVKSELGKGTTFTVDIPKRKK